MNSECSKQTWNLRRQTREKTWSSIALCRNCEKRVEIYVPTLSETFTRLCRNIVRNLVWSADWLLMLCTSLYPNLHSEKPDKSVPVGTLWKTCFDPHINCCSCVQLCTGTYILINLNKSVAVLIRRLAAVPVYKYVPEPKLWETWTSLCLWLHCEKPVLIRILTVVPVYKYVPEPTLCEPEQVGTPSYIVRNLFSSTNELLMLCTSLYRYVHSEKHHQVPTFCYFCYWPSRGKKKLICFKSFSAY